MLLINGRWTRLDEIISVGTTVAADPTIPATGNLTCVRRGRPDMVFRVSGFIEVSTRRSGRQQIAITNQEQ